MIVKNARSPVNWLLAASVVFVVTWFGLRSSENDQVALSPESETPDVGALLVVESKKSPAVVSKSDEEVTRVTGGGRFIGNQVSDVWPPQPMGISSVRALELPPQLALDESFQQAGPTAREVAEASNSVRVLLGNRYKFISQRPVLAKWSKEHLGDEAVFYSYDQNLTVVAVVEQAQVVDVQGILPTEFQPPLAPDEKARATELARSYWQAAGDVRIDDLEAFAILTYDGADGHAVRMAYVTFHYTSTINPELLTWVDLTNERVDRSLVQRAGVIQ